MQTVRDSAAEYRFNFVFRYTYHLKIPTEILLGYVFHTKPYRGDQGIQFESLEHEE